MQWQGILCYSTVVTLPLVLFCANILAEAPSLQGIENVSSKLEFFGLVSVSRRAWWTREFLLDDEKGDWPLLSGLYFVLLVCLLRLCAWLFPFYDKIKSHETSVETTIMLMRDVTSDIRSMRAASCLSELQVACYFVDVTSSDCLTDSFSSLNHSFCTIELEPIFSQERRKRKKPGVKTT